MADEPKLCSVCGIDVSGKPRAKDAQGRYTCAECLEKAKQTRQTQQNPPKPAPAAAAVNPEDDNSFILDIGGKALGAKGGKACPNCGRIVAEHTVVCIGCGFNTTTGKQVQIKVMKAKKEKGDAAPTGSGGLGIVGDFLSWLNASPILFVGIYIAIVGGLVGGGIATQNGLMAGIGILVWALVALFMHVVATIFAFKDSGPLYGIGCLICGFIMLYWILNECERDVIKYVWITSFAFGFALKWIIPMIDAAGGMGV
ncbi:MAG: hypothetical protein JSR77_10915 [Planctomycetes bacterium]|nr:hypothetical protein [Planctomycetota bacterium]